MAALSCVDVNDFCIQQLATLPGFAARRCVDDECFAEKYRWQRRNREEPGWISHLLWQYMDVNRTRPMGQQPMHL